MWDPRQYGKFSNQRARPFFDLLAQIDADDPRLIVDLGCGTGRLTQTLSQRWPAAKVIGVDNSAEMLQDAFPHQVPNRLEFVQASIEEWVCPEPVDLIISNAALHWVADHDRLLERLAGMLLPSGTLAVQMPSRFATASQTAIDDAAADPRWSDRLRGSGLHRQSVMSLSSYVHRLHELDFAVNAWETTYVHVLEGENPVLDWLQGTALRPLLDRLDGHAAENFLAEVGARLKAAYPSAGDVTLFPFPRLFFVATRGKRNKTLGRSSTHT